MSVVYQSFVWHVETAMIGASHRYDIVMTDEYRDDKRRDAGQDEHGDGYEGDYNAILRSMTAAEKRCDNDDSGGKDVLVITDRGTEKDARMIVKWARHCRSTVTAYTGRTRWMRSRAYIPPNTVQEVGRSVEKSKGGSDRPTAPPFR